MQKWQKLRIFHGWFNITNSVTGIRKKVYNKSYIYIIVYNFERQI